MNIIRLIVPEIDFWKDYFQRYVNLICFRKYLKVVPTYKTHMTRSKEYLIIQNDFLLNVIQPIISEISFFKAPWFMDIETITKKDLFIGIFAVTYNYTYIVIYGLNVHVISV